MEPLEVAEDAAGGDDKEVSALLNDTRVELLRGLFKLPEELLEEEGVRRPVVAPPAMKSGTSNLRSLAMPRTRRAKLSNMSRRWRAMDRRWLALSRAR